MGSFFRIFPADIRPNVPSWLRSSSLETLDENPIRRREEWHISLNTGVLPMWSLPQGSPLCLRVVRKPSSSTATPYPDCRAGIRAAGAKYSRVGGL